LVGATKSSAKKMMKGYVLSLKKAKAKKIGAIKQALIKDNKKKKMLAL